MESFILLPSLCHADLRFGIMAWMQPALEATYTLSSRGG
jgi:hypothetical protein